MELKKKITNSNLFIGNDNSKYLTIKEVASKYGDKIECLFYDYDNNWKRKIMKVNSSFLKDMEQGSIKECKYMKND